MACAVGSFRLSHYAKRNVEQTDTHMCKAYRAMYRALLATPSLNQSPSRPLAYL
jgi:hypothetical protein